MVTGLSCALISLLLTPFGTTADGLTSGGNMLVSINDFEPLNIHACTSPSSDEIIIDIEPHQGGGPTPIMDATFYAWFLDSTDECTSPEDYSDKATYGSFAYNTSDDNVEYPKDFPNASNLTPEFLFSTTPGNLNCSTLDTTYRMCFAIDNDNTSNIDVGPDSSDNFAWMDFRVKTTHPPSASGMSPTPTDAAIKLLASFDASDDSEIHEIKSWAVYLREHNSSANSFDCSDVSAWHDPQIVAVSSGSDTFKIDASPFQHYDLCIFSLDEVDNSGLNGYPLPNVYAIEECNFIECSDPKLETGFCGVGGGSIVSVLFILFCLLRHKNWRPRLPHSSLLVMFLACTWLPTAKAQDYKAQKNTPPSLFVGLKVTPYNPKISGNDKVRTWYESVYATGRDKALITNYPLLTQLEVSWLPWRPFGLIGFSGSIGYWSVAGLEQTCLNSMGEPQLCNGKQISYEPGDTVAGLKVLPLNLTATYRFNYLTAKHYAPFDFYVRAGLNYSFWWNSSDSPRDDSRSNGGNWGLDVTGGLALNLNWIEPRVAATARTNMGMTGSYLFAECKWLWSNNFGKTNNLDLSATLFSIGLRVAFL